MALLSWTNSETLYVAPEGNTGSSIKCLVAAGLYLLFFFGCLFWKKASDKLIVRSDSLYQVFSTHLTFQVSSQ